MEAKRVTNVSTKSTCQPLMQTTLTCRLVLGSLAMRWPLMSNSLTCLLSSGIATTPEFETARRLAAESDRIVARGDRMLRRSHTLTLRSSEPDTTLSSFVNTAQVTVLWKQCHLIIHALSCFMTSVKPYLTNDKNSAYVVHFFSPTIYIVPVT